MLLRWLLCSLSLIGASWSDVKRSARVRRIVGGSQAQLPPADDPKVYLQFASKAAEIKGVLDAPHYVFRGLRFGMKPSGKDRFQRPRQYFLEGNIDATLYPPPCLQTIPGDQRVIGSEDCLFLNVFTPDLPDGTEGLPVVVWIHGGDFRFGSASQYGVRNLVGRQLVIVSIQYRLGTLGFLSTGTPELPGNAALWDMALAVQWVRNYIGFFGGNPHRIVVMGQGTGASSALMLALSSIAKGTVSAVVAMSGTAVSNWAIENAPAISAREIGEYHGCPVTSAMILLKCLQSLDAAQIAEGDAALVNTRLSSRGFVPGLNGVLGAAPNAEGRFDGRSLPAAVEEKPMDEMTKGNIPSIPLLTGTTKHETKRAVQHKYKSEIIEKLKGVPNFLDQVLIKNLQECIGIERKCNNCSQSKDRGDLFQLLNPLQFRNYLKITKNNLVEGLQKIAEVTCDALFNLPAFLTANLWSKKSKVYLYQFEHVGKSKRGYARYFLKGHSLIGNESSEMDDTVSHGDDLAFVFEARHLNGSELQSQPEMSPQDEKVRDEYVRMIAEFAKTGKISVDNQPAESFTGSNFIQIGSKAKVSTNYRFCEMALWAGLTERLQSASCTFLNALDTSVKNVENLFFDTVSPNKVGETISGAPKAIGNALGGINPLNLFGKKTTRAARKPNVVPNHIPPMGFLD